MKATTPEEALAQTLVRFRSEGSDHISCSQAVTLFSLLVLGDDPDLAVAAQYLGGGLAGMGETCGALTGAAVALGLRSVCHGQESEDATPTATEFLQQLVRDFEREFGSRRCFDLTGFDLSDPEQREAFFASDIRPRCQDYVTWSCKRLTPFLLGADSPRS